MLMSGLGALIMLGICGLSGFFVVVDERRGHGAEAAERTAEPDRIGSRRVDARPLTVPEVFPKAQIRPAQGAGPYSIRDTHNGDCDIAVTGRLDIVLSDHACSQVVRASMTAPYGGYRVTAGLFNLAEATDAAAVGEQARQLVETGGGTFAAMAAPGTDPLAQPPAQANWHEHGHYLIYCVISRPDGRVVSDADANARRIIAEVMESYLGGEVLGRRASGT
jgi:hypothetical protein